MSISDILKFPVKPDLFHIEDRLSSIDESGWYRVLRKLDFRQMLESAPASFPLDASYFILLDTECTGKERTDKIVELGMVRVAYDSMTGVPYGIHSVYSALEDPGIPMSEEATWVNGITDDMLRGHRFDDVAVKEFVDGADFVACHNANFDRGMVEKRFPWFSAHRFACSLRDVDWRAAKIFSARQENLAAEAGFYYEAHRAVADCLALLEILQFAYPALPSGTALSAILDALETESRKIWAVGAPISKKDLLKQRGYRWHAGDVAGEEKAWAIEVPASDFAAEMAWLKAEIQNGRDVYLPVDRIDSLCRFSSRRVPLQRDATGDYV